MADMSESTAAKEELAGTDTVASSDDSAVPVETKEEKKGDTEKGSVETEGEAQSADNTDKEIEKAIDLPAADNERKGVSSSGDVAEQPSLKRKLDESEVDEDSQNKRAKVEENEEKEKEEATADRDDGREDKAATEEKEADLQASVELDDKDQEPASDTSAAEKDKKTEEAVEASEVSEEGKQAKNEETKEKAREKDDEEKEKLSISEKKSEGEEEKMEVGEEKMEVGDAESVQKDSDTQGGDKTQESDKNVDSNTASSVKPSQGEPEDPVKVKAEDKEDPSVAVVEQSAREEDKNKDGDKHKDLSQVKKSEACRDHENDERREGSPLIKTEVSDRGQRVKKELMDLPAIDRVREFRSRQVKEETPSVKSDSGSDKENQGSELPMDLSNSGTPEQQDVIMLSDEDEAAEPKSDGVEDKETMRRRRVKRLQSELRNEEAKLVLLKKLRQSQLAPQLQDHPQIPGAVPNNVAGSQMKPGMPRQSGGPPPLVRGGQQGRTPGMQMQSQQGRSGIPGQSRTMQGPPPLIGAPGTRVSNTNGHGTHSSIRGNLGVHGMNQHSSSSHRALQQQQQQSSSQQQAQVQQVPQAATPPQPPVDTQTPAQRQAAAKLALRKQLEKTLLQIPPPKPPAPEMNFIPSLACPDFVLLLGLEEVVNHIIDLQLIARGQKSADEKFICTPFTCVQCGSDYTPVWKREKPGSKNVICEHCVTWNQKRALKQEHTNRLKSAFVKALQQEQEIERMQASTLASTPPAPSPAVTPPAPVVTAPPQAIAAAANSVAAAAAMSLNSASYRASAEQVRQHHSLLQQAHQAQLRGQLPGLQGFGPRSPFPYSLPYMKQADLQRQYLLDMIPRAGMSWKP